MAVDSGRIWLDGEVIRYRSKTYGNLDIPLSDVRVIGEATNQSGPFVDDYFFCFATGPDCWYETSYYAKGCGEFFTALSDRLHFQLQTGLANSTDFASRVLWPLDLVGEPMFTYTDVEPKTWLGRLFWPLRNEQTYTDAIMDYLNDRG